MYLGRNPAVGTQRMLDSIESQFNGALTTFDLRYGGVPTYPTLSESLIVSLGGVLQEPGEAYYVSSDKIVFSEAPNAGTECWILLYSQYGAAASSTPSLALQATGEPMGFENRTHSTISFDNGSLTFSIAPNTSGGYSSYAVWTKGTKRVISDTKSVQIGTTTGLYYIYFDAFGDLQYKTTYFTWDTETPVAYVYLNASSLPSVVAPFVADERHGVVLDWQTHEYLHRTRGAVIAEGFSISPVVIPGTGNGSADGEAKFDLGNGTFFDEDLEVNITHSTSPTVGTFTQILQDGAEIPVFYMSGAAGAWLNDPATKFACKQSATTLQYNSYVQGQWSTTPADNNRYVVSWIVATNDITAPVICILGQEQYTAIGSAEAVKFGDLTLTNFPIVEFRPLWKVIFQTSTGFTNTPNALIANFLDLRQLSETGEAGTIVSDHGLLSGLTDDDHSQYLHTTLTRAGITADISTTGNLGGRNLTLSSQLNGPANFIIDPAAVGDDTGTVEIKGNLTVQGTTTTINSTTVDLDNLALGDNEKFLIGDGGAGDNGGIVKDFEIYSNGSSVYFDSPYIYTGDAAVSPNIYFRTSAVTTLDTNALSILASGNVGIGIANPTDKLHVHGGSNNYTPIGSGSGLFKLTGGAASQYSMYIGIDNDGGYIGHNGASRKLFFDVNESTRMTIDGSGNVGIGLTNPATKLHVYTGNATGVIARFEGKVGRVLYTGTDILGHYIEVQGTGPGERILRTQVFDGTSGYAQVFLDGANKYLYTSSNVSVGIGTTNPTQKLHVYGSGQQIIKLQDSGNTNGLDIGNNTTESFISTVDTKPIIFYTNNLERLRIDAAGNARLYESGANGNSRELNFEVYGGTASEGNGVINFKRSRSSIADTQAPVVNNILGQIKFSGSNGTSFVEGARIEAKSFSTWSETDNATDLIFHTTPDNSTILTEVLRIKYDGNVGIGTTNPQAKLDVAGNVQPSADATHNLGAPAARWANIYSADLQLSNEGSPTGNEVDGTWGAYTIQEGEEALYLINRRSGKKFKFVLEEVK